MFQLAGVAGYLFRPMAEAVLFALIGSFILSRTLVPTMANFLMRDSHAGAHPHEVAAQTSGGWSGPFTRFQAGFEAHFARVRERYRTLLARALGRPTAFMIVSSPACCSRFCLRRFLAGISFPQSTPDRS